MKLNWSGSKWRCSHQQWLCRCPLRSCRTSLQYTQTPPPHPVNSNAAGEAEGIPRSHTQQVHTVLVLPLAAFPSDVEEQTHSNCYTQQNLRENNNGRQYDGQMNTGCKKSQRARCTRVERWRGGMRNNPGRQLQRKPTTLVNQKNQ